MLFASVANFAALTALPVPATGADGLLVYTESVKDYFHLDTNSTLTVDGVTVLATFLGGTTRWIRMEFAHPFWLLTSAWGVDPVVGNDENVGSVASPLKTFAELARRWGLYGRLKQNTAVTLLGDLPASDPISFKVELVGVRLNIIGTVTVVRSGSFTGVTARNEATNTPWQVVDAAMAGTWTTDIGRRLKLTSGAGVNGVSYIAKDLGAKTARTSEWGTIPSPPGVSGTFVVPAPADTYNVEQISSAIYGDCSVRSANVSTVGIITQCSFIDIRFAGTSFAQFPFIVGAPFYAFYGCRFDQGASNCAQLQSFWTNCDFVGPWQTTEGAFASLDMGIARSTSFLFGGIVIFDGHFFCQGKAGAGGVVVGGFAKANFSEIAVFDAAASSLNPTAAGILVGTTSANGHPFMCFAGSNTGNHATNAVWGSGNAGPGIDVHSGSFIFDSQPTITGSVDFALGGSVVAFPFDPATGTYNGGVGIGTAWANMPGALPGGFNNGAHYPARDCHMQKLA